uniref:DEK-C domain-containing protein n=1 Tax=Ananas comosus var. bracteatus TaxID=296719 RepID=A0A6V7PNB2_ANACO|nr:unnamed protein product [Ananas comosus var. bracteatus]
MTEEARASEKEAMTVPEDIGGKDVIEVKIGKGNDESAVAVNEEVEGRKNDNDVAMADAEDDKAAKEAKNAGCLSDPEVADKKRSQSQKVNEEENVKGDKVCETNSEETFKTPVSSYSDRPVRERRTVDRLVNAVEKRPTKTFFIEKGRGTPLKEIPNGIDSVFCSLSFYLVADCKSHVLQFSGFVWRDDEDKEKAKVKERLHQYNKDTLLMLCNLFDLPAAKINTRKGKLVASLLDFLEAPQAITDVAHSGKEQNRKRKRVASKSSGSGRRKGSKKGDMSDDSSETDLGNSSETNGEEEENDETNLADEDDGMNYPESEEKNNESDQNGDNNEESQEDNSEKNKPSEKGASAGTEKPNSNMSFIKTPLPTTAKCPTKSASPKQAKAGDSNDTDGQSPKSKTVDTSKDKATAKEDNKEKSAGKEMAEGQSKSGMKVYGPTKERVRKAICHILEYRVNYNTATFNDILKELEVHFDRDLSSRKNAIKLMVEEEVVRLSEEAAKNEAKEQNKLGADEPASGEAKA